MITLHYFDAKLIHDLYESRVLRVVKLLEKVKGDSQKISRLALVSSETMGYAFGLHKEAATCREYLDITKDALVGNFALAIAKVDSVEVVIGGEIVSLAPVVAKQRLDAPHWRIAFFLALCRRDQNALNILLAVPDDLLETASGEHDGYQLTYVQFLKALMNGDANKGQLLLAATQKMGVNQIINADQNYVAFIENPQMNLWASLLANEEEEFLSRWLEAVKQHKQFWSQKRGLNRGDAPLYNSAEGYFSAPLTAIAALAYDRGICTDFNTAYTPSYLIEK